MGRPETHGLTRMKQAVRVLGGRLIDRRTSVGKALDQWRRDLVADLGGGETISTQQAALIELAVRSKLLLDSIDAYLLALPTLVNKRRKALLPVVRERQALADGLARYLTTLGLQRRQADVTDVVRELAAMRTNGGANNGAP